MGKYTINAPYGEEIPVEEQVKFFNSVGKWPKEWDCLSEDQCEKISKWVDGYRKRIDEEHKNEIDRAVISGYMAAILPFSVFMIFVHGCINLLDAICQFPIWAGVSFIVYLFWCEFFRYFKRDGTEPITKVELLWKSIVTVVVVAFGIYSLLHI